MARSDASVLEVWTCLRPNCGAHNIAASSHCTVCSAPKQGVRPIPGERILPAVDLEVFCRRNFKVGAKRPRAELHILDNEVYLTLSPDRPDGTPPAVFHVDQNEIHPCDSLGRRGW